MVSGRKKPASTGTRNTATKSDETSDMTTVKIMPLNSWPIMPRSFRKKRKGTKTQMVVRLPEKTDMSISELPSTAATRGFAPRER